VRARDAEVDHAARRQVGARDPRVLPPPWTWVLKVAVSCRAAETSRWPKTSGAAMNSSKTTGVFAAESGQPAAELRRRQETTSKHAVRTGDHVAPLLKDGPALHYNRDPPKVDECYVIRMLGGQTLGSDDHFRDLPADLSGWRAL
jgi:hypothetical protein